MAVFLCRVGKRAAVSVIIFNGIVRDFLTAFAAFERIVLFFPGMVALGLMVQLVRNNSYHGNQ
jgi:hypothetical protein